jgi:hypothetical protein
MLQSLQGSEILDDIDSDFAEILDSADHTGEDKRALCEKFETASHERYVTNHISVYNASILHRSIDFHFRANQLLDSTASETNESASFLYNESRTWKLIAALFK